MPGSPFIDIKRLVGIQMEYLFDFGKWSIRQIIAGYGKS